MARVAIPSDEARFDNATGVCVSPTPPQPAPPNPARFGADEPLPAAPRRALLWGWVLLTLLVSSSGTVLLYRHQQARRQLDQRKAIEQLADKSYLALGARLASSELLLRAVQSLFIASDHVTEQDFGHIYANLHPRTLFPSLVAMVYAQRETRSDDAHYITRWVEPQAGNEALIGLDVGTQAPNMTALRGARDSNRPTLSAPFVLRQTDATGRPIRGVALRLPIYSGGPPPDTLAQRHARLIGSIALSFRVSSLIQTALPPRALQQLHIEVSDITGTPQPLFDSLPDVSLAAGEPVYQRDVNYGSRVWRLQMTARASASHAAPWTSSLLPVGLLISLLLTLLVWSVVNTRQRALELGWRMSRRYRDSEERFRVLNEQLPALVLLADAHSGRIHYANQASRDRLGHDLPGQVLPLLFEDPQARAQLRGAQAGGGSPIEAVLHAGKGPPFWAMVSVTRILLDGMAQLLVVATDISEQRELNAMLRHQASHDTLTELYNRREFERRVGLALEAVTQGGPSAALLYLDLDQFKLINDTSGHTAGDQLLAQLAMLMHEHLRADDVLARLGGDEFGVLLQQVPDRSVAEPIAEQLRQRIDGYIFVWEQRSYTVSASIGAVMLDQPGLSLREAFAQADTACYMAKEQGRNRLHFYSGHDNETVRRRSEMEWAQRLRWAADQGRLLLMYQELWPVSAPAGTGAQIELLLRFREEDGSLVLPGAFLPAAERYGLMPLIDRWVIETALAHFDQLHPAGAALTLATINLSGASVDDDALAERIIELLAFHRVAPSRVCFEITETVAVRNLAQVARFMQRLRAVGCKVALDDFGAGMSSFGYLKHLPVDIIKIDGSFIRDMLTDPVSYAMVRAVTDIGHQIGLKVVAEWVTGEDTLQALRTLEVDLAQGFGLHVPERVPFLRD